MHLSCPVHDTLDCLDSLKRHRRPDQWRSNRRRRADRNHDRVSEWIQERIGIPLPIVGQPDVTGGINLASGNPFQGVAPIAGGRRDRVSDFHPVRTLLRRHAAEPADPRRNLGACADRDLAEIEHPDCVIAVRCDSPGKRQTTAGKGRSGMRFPIVHPVHRDGWIGRGTQVGSGRAGRIKPVRIGHPDVPFAIRGISERVAEDCFSLVCARQGIDRVPSWREKLFQGMSLP